MSHQRQSALEVRERKAAGDGPTLRCRRHGDHWTESGAARCLGARRRRAVKNRRDAAMWRRVNGALDRGAAEADPDKVREARARFVRTVWADRL